jgi:hypothetical protein
VSRKIKRVLVNSRPLDLDTDTPIGILRDQLNELIKIYGKEAELSCDAGYENISTTLYVYRKENDTEYKQRLKEERVREKNQKERDLKEYERLKKVFERNEPS